MKRKLAAGVLSVILAISMMAGTFFTADGTDRVQAAEESQTSAPENRTWDLASDSTAVRPTLEKATGEFEGITINAENGKFAPRESDTQINEGTVLTIPVEANSGGAVLTFRLSGGSATLAVGESSRYASTGGAIAIKLEPSEIAKECVVSFIEENAYLSSIELTYSEPTVEYPGTPDSAAAEDVTYTFESADGLLDESGNAAAGDKLEGNRGTFGDMKVDATAGKFNIQPDQSRVVINAGTVLYIPAAYDEKGAALLIAGTQDGSTPSEIKVNGASYTSNEEIALDMTDKSAYPQYLKVEFDTICYANSISLNYASDSDYGIPDVQAKEDRKSVV